MRWTQLLKSWAKNTEGRTGEKDKFKDFKQKNTFNRIGRKGTVCVCVYFWICVCDSARKLESENARQCEVGERCFREGELACGCVPLYPLFIHSLLSQSLGNETGDRNEDLRGGPLSLHSFSFVLFTSHSESAHSPPRHLHLSMALDHFKMSGPSPQIAEPEEKYHRSYLGLQTMNPNCS